jgi:hypothetical protein
MAGDKQIEDLLDLLKAALQISPVLVFQRGERFLEMLSSKNPLFLCP